MKKIKIHIDGPSNKEINEYYKNVDGFTFNPSLFRKLKVSNYLAYTKSLLKMTKNKPLSIEVFADDEKIVYIKLKKLAR